jgi:hypothetical protein
MTSALWGMANFDARVATGCDANGCYGSATISQNGVSVSINGLSDVALNSLKTAVNNGQVSVESMTIPNEDGSITLYNYAVIHGGDSSVPLPGFDWVQVSYAAMPANNADPCDALCQAVFHSRQAQNTWKQADCTINGPLKDEATGLIDTAATATATGVITARSAGTSLTKGATKELSGSFTELFGIIEYGKVMLKMGYNMVAGCQ